MMKAWLSALGKLLLEFLMLLILLSAAGAFASTLDAPSFGAFGRAIIARSLLDWPVALSLALTTGIISFAGARSATLRSLLSVALAGLVIAAAGTAARSLDWQPEPVPSAFPVAGQAVESGDRLASVSAIEAAKVRGLVTVDWAKAMPRLSWRATAPFDAASSSAMAGSARWSLVPVWEKEESPISTGLPWLDGLRPPLAQVEDEGLAKNLARAFGFVILCIGFGSLSLRFRLPISALIVAVLAALAAALLDATLFATRLPLLAASLQTSSGFELIAGWMIPGSETILGLVAATIGFFLARGVRR
ncbi:MAG TPA: hypothetical protein VMV83_02405 [Rectinemataceae bacterium]|nr:hypothetical protein [Rectinemataceae bacterium]